MLPSCNPSADEWIQLMMKALKPLMRKSSLTCNIYNARGSSRFKDQVLNICSGSKWQKTVYSLGTKIEYTVYRNSKSILRCMGTVRLQMFLSNFSKSIIKLCGVRSDPQGEFSRGNIAIQESAFKTVLHMIVCMNMVQIKMIGAKFGDWSFLVGQLESTKPVL